MEYNIGILWPGNVDDKDYKLPDDVCIIPNVRVSDATELSKQLIADGVKILICPPSMASELRNSSIPVAISHVSYIDILETLWEAEQQYYPHFQQCALVFHSSNPTHLERTMAFTKFEMSYYHYDNSEYSLQAVIKTIRKNGYPLVIGGHTSTALAAREGLEAFPLRYRSQSLASGIQKAREILELIRAEQYQLERLRTVLDIIPDGILVTEKDGTISMCNSQMAAFMSTTQELLQGRSVSEIFEDDSWRSVHQDGRSQTHLLIKYHDHEYFSTRRPIMENGQPVGAVGIMQEARQIQSMGRKYRRIRNTGLSAKHHFSNIIHQSAVMSETVEQAKKYARFEATVLIEGETGTGKELFAQSIHNESSRKNGPFVAVNCAAIAENLLESELMGYEEGAFTGAKRGGKIGLFEQANNGTIFLDEINQMPLSLQPKILRVIQERTLTRVGGYGAVPINVRIITAANENLAGMVAKGSFRSDLYYRLNVLMLHIPPLRERTEDVLPLILHFLRQFDGSTLSPSIDPQKMCQDMANYSWPGNVRELQNYVERCSILGTTAINRQFFPGVFSSESRNNSNISSDSEKAETLRIRFSTMEDMEKQIVKQTLERCNGNKSKAALLLNINRNTISKKSV